MEKFKIRSMAGKFKPIRLPGERERKIHKLKCKTCGLVFDYGIMRWPIEKKEEFECPHCIILNNDPLNEVIDVLYPPSILKSNMNYKYHLPFNKL